MKEEYLVTSTGNKDGSPYSTLTRIVRGTKLNGDRYCFADKNRSIVENEELPLGAILPYETSRSAASNGVASSFAKTKAETK